MGAGASHQRPTRTQHLQSAQIELFVTAQGARHGALGLRKSGGIEHHRVKSSARSAPIAEKIECVGLDPFDRCLDPGTVNLKVLFRHLERRPGSINAGHVGTGSCQVQRETALVGADIQGFAMGIARCGRVVQALIKESSRLLSGVRVVVKSQPIEVKDRP